MTEIKIREKNPDPWPHQHPGGGVGSTSSSQKKRKKKGGCGLTLPPDWLHPPCPPPHYPPSHTLIHTPSGETACQRKCSRTLGHRLIIHRITQESSVCVCLFVYPCVCECVCVLLTVCVCMCECVLCVEASMVQGTAELHRGAADWRPLGVTRDRAWWRQREQVIDDIIITITTTVIYCRTVMTFDLRLVDSDTVQWFNQHLKCVNSFFLSWFCIFTCLWLCFYYSSEELKSEERKNFFYSAVKHWHNIVKGNFTIFQCIDIFYSQPWRHLRVLSMITLLIKTKTCDFFLFCFFF